MRTFAIIVTFCVFDHFGISLDRLEFIWCVAAMGIAIYQDYKEVKR